MVNQYLRFIKLYLENNFLNVFIPTNKIYEKNGQSRNIVFTNKEDKIDNEEGCVRVYIDIR